MVNFSVPIEVVVIVSLIIGLILGALIGLCESSEEVEEEFDKVRELWEEDRESYDRLLSSLKEKYLEVQRKYDRLLSALNRGGKNSPFEKAKEIANELENMPEQIRDYELSKLEQSDPVVHALVTQLLEQSTVEDQHG